MSRKSNPLLFIINRIQCCLSILASIFMTIRKGEHEKYLTFALYPISHINISQI